jgi:sulfur-carrier protein
MTVAVFRIPSQLRPLTGGAGEVVVEGDSVAVAIDSLDELHPGMRERLLDEQGRLRRFLNLFVADEDVRFLDGLETRVESGQTISIVPAIAGG